MTPFIWHSWKRQSEYDRSQSSGCQWTGWERAWRSNTAGGQMGGWGRGGSVSESVSNNINLCIILRTIPQKVNFLVFSFKNIKLRKKRADNSHFLLKAIQIIQSKSVPLLWQTGSSSTAFGVSAARGSSSKHLASWLRMCTITLEGGLGLGLIYRKNWG